MINIISNFFIPIIVLFIIIYAIYKKVNVYDSFVNGAKDGIGMCINIFPCLLAMIFGMNLLIRSNVIIDIFSYFKPLLNLFNIPVEILPLAITRPISGNASFVVMIDIIKTYGVDSILGRIAAVMQGATDTTIYVLTLYFGSIGIKNTKYALKVGLMADLIAIIMSILLVNLLF